MANGIHDAFEYPLGFRKAESGGYYMWGRGNQGFVQSPEGGHGFLSKVDSNLRLLWLRRFQHPSFLYTEGNSGSYYLNDIAEAPDGSVYLVGHIWGYSPPDYPYDIERLWLLHVDEYGCLEPGCHLVGTEEIITHMTETMSVYPNPARGSCTIAFSLIEGYTAPGQSQLKLTDMQGRIVRTIALAGAEVAAGHAQIDLSGMVPGVYVGHWMDGGRWMDSMRIVVE